MTPLEQALWANAVQRKCLIESGGDVASAMQATEIILSNYTPERFDVSEQWVTVPDTFLQIGGQPATVALSTEPVKPPDIIIHNHVSAPDIVVNVPQSPAPTVRVDAPVINVASPEVKAPVVNVEQPAINVNVPQQQPPTVNVAAPVVHVAPPNVTVTQPTIDKHLTIKKDGAGQWSAEVKS